MHAKISQFFNVSECNAAAARIAARFATANYVDAFFIESIRRFDNEKIKVISENLRFKNPKKFNDYEKESPHYRAIADFESFIKDLKIIEKQVAFFCRGAKYSNKDYATAFVYIRGDNNESDIIACFECNKSILSFIGNCLFGTRDFDNNLDNLRQQSNYLKTLLTTANKIEKSVFENYADFENFIKNSPQFEL